LEVDEIAAQAMEPRGAEARIFDHIQLVHVIEQFGNHYAFDPATEAGLGFEVRIFFCEMQNSGAGFPVAKPIMVTAVTPFGNVVLGDGPAAEVLGQHGFDFGQLIEPGDGVFAEDSVEQLLIQLFADGFGEAGDFTGSGFHNFLSADFEEVRRLNSRCLTFCVLLFIWSGFSMDPI
jgi:hypothetical protein